MAQLVERKVGNLDRLTFRQHLRELAPSAPTATSSRPNHGRQTQRRYRQPVLVIKGQRKFLLHPFRRGVHVLRTRRMLLVDRHVVRRRELRRRIPLISGNAARKDEPLHLCIAGVHQQVRQPQQVDRDHLQRIARIPWQRRHVVDDIGIEAAEDGADRIERSDVALQPPPRHTLGLRRAS